MGDYSFGPGPGGWNVIITLCIAGILAIAWGLASTVLYLIHHLQWVR
jgi:hypothetical protein